MRGRGRRRAGEDNVRLRQRVRDLSDDVAWHRKRLMAVTARCRALAAQAEIADGQQVLAEQLIARQVRELMDRDSEIEDLRRQLKAATDDTVEVPIVTVDETELATA